MLTAGMSTIHVEHVWRCVDERFADVKVVNRVPDGGGGLMVWPGISYGQRTQLHFLSMSI